MDFKPHDIFSPRIRSSVYVVIKKTNIDGLIISKVIGVYENYWDAEHFSGREEYEIQGPFNIIGKNVPSPPNPFKRYL
tara:strand:- start:121 stop:354 length:234 start_codon:yes stop_codon:yes gene_type:complete